VGLIADIGGYPEALAVGLGLAVDAPEPAPPENGVGLVFDVGRDGSKAGLGTGFGAGSDKEKLLPFE
jgi:hypothetical protein